MSLARNRRYVAEGFLGDCDKLIQRCAQYGTLNYEKFCDVWKEMNFVHVYHGRGTGAEIAELSEEVLHLAKHYMIDETSNFEASVAGLFLVYALLNLQPYENFAALRLIPQDVASIHRLASTARQQRRCDVLYILGSVLIKGPCQFQAAQRERGMENPIKKYVEGNILLEKLGALQRGVFYRQDEEFNLIKDINTLSKSYTAAKAEIYGTNKEDRSLTYAKENFGNELESSLKKLVDGPAEDNSNEDENSTEDSHMQSIKDRAMKNVVNPMKHLTGLQERKTKGTGGKKSPVKKSEKKTCKEKSVSPTKALATSSPKKARKRRAPTRKPSKKKAKFKSDTEDEEYISTDEDAEINIAEFIKASDKNVQKQDLSVSKKNDPKVQVKGESSSKGSVEDFRVENVRNKVPKTLQFLKKRDLKKSVVKSKFKRMGMLPVANFKETS